jgi:hypothetical protein
MSTGRGSSKVASTRWFRTIPRILKEKVKDTKEKGLPILADELRLHNR